MAIDEAEVRRIAALARLALDDDEVKRYTRDLSSMIAYVKKVEELDVSGVPPTAHAVTEATPFRPDVAVQSPVLERALANAPAQRDHMVVVPKVL